MKKIPLTTPYGNSDILIESGLFAQIGNLLTEKYPESRKVIILDSNLDAIYGAKLKAELPDALKLVIPAGEESKELKFVVSLIEKLLEAGFGRNDVLIGFGGGMTTDLAGFVASVYMRGMHFVSIPTSLLGMVDAAIGGKTAINLGAKNIIGTFYLADEVLIDPELLNSFVDPKKIPGMGEVAKYAAIIDASLFAELEKTPMDLTSVITKSVNAKVNVVSQDFKESGMRKWLNYGHTFGHAIESVTNFALSHDQAISIGMVLSNRIAQKLGKQNESVGNTIEQTLSRLNLPTELPKNVRLEECENWMMKDKKRAGDHIGFIIVPELGKAEIIPLKPEELINLAK